MPRLIALFNSIEGLLLLPGKCVTGASGRSTKRPATLYQCGVPSVGLEDALGSCQLALIPPRCGRSKIHV